MTDFLNEQEFYEMCQQYRHAPDAIAPRGMLTAAEAFEELKQYIRDNINAVAPSSQHLETVGSGLKSD